jgi:hypothetical protein
MDIKILRRAVPLHIGKHLMPEMGGGLIRAYRRPQRHEGQAVLCCPQPTFFKITIGEHRRRHIRVRTAQSRVRDAADDLGSRQGGGRAAVPPRPNYHLSSNRFVQGGGISPPHSSRNQGRSITDCMPERALIPGAAIVDQDELGLASSLPSILNLTGRLGGR